MSVIFSTTIWPFTPSHHHTFYAVMDPPIAVAIPIVAVTQDHLEKAHINPRQRSLSLSLTDIFPREPPRPPSYSYRRTILSPRDHLITRPRLSLRLSLCLSPTLITLLSNLFEFIDPLRTHTRPPLVTPSRHTLSSHPLLLI